MHPHELEEEQAWFSQNDRYDGFDRGDCDSHAEYFAAQNELDEAERLANLEP